MTRKIQGGYGLNANLTKVATPGGEFDAVTGVGMSIASTNARTGTYCGHCLNPSSSVGAGWRLDFLATAVNTGKYYARLCVKIDVLPNGTTGIFGLSNNSGQTVAACRFLAMTSAGALQLYDSTGTQVGSNSPTLSTGVYHTIDLLVDFTTPKCEVRVDGFVVITDNTMANTTTINHMYWGMNLFGKVGSTNSTASLYFDDYALNDNSGTNQTGYIDPNEGYYYLFPTGNAATSSMTTYLIKGSSPAATHWQSINEIPPDDGTTYIQRPLSTDTGGSGVADRGNDFTATDPVATYGFRAADTITCVQVHVRGGNTSATTDSTIRNVFTRLKSHDGGGTPASNVLESSASVHLNVNIVTPNWITDGTSNTSSPWPNPMLTSYGIVASTGVPLGDVTIDGSTNIAWPVDDTVNHWDLKHLQIGIHSESTAQQTTVAPVVTTLYAVVARIPGPINVTINDTINLSDTTTRAAAFVRSITDSEGFTDGATPEVGGSTINRTLSEAFGLTDVVPRQYAFVLTDSIGMTDTGLAVTSSPDHFEMTDYLGRDLGRTITDGLGMTDAVAFVSQAPGVVNITDREALTDNLTAGRVISRVINDGLVMSDTALAHAALSTLMDAVIEISREYDGWSIE